MRDTSSKMILMTSAAIVAAVAISGCGKNDSTEKPLAGKLAGDWATTCIPSGSNSNIYSLSVTDGVFARAEMPSADATCTSPLYIATYGYTYTIGAELTSPEGATELDGTLVKAEITPMSAAGVAYLANSCGKTWVVGTAEDVTTCAAIQASYGGYYSIFTANTTVDPATLEIGDCLTDPDVNCTTSAKRATAFSVVKLTKQTATTAIRK